MPFNTDEFTKHLRQHAAGHSVHRCARYVRLALEAGGADTKGYQVPAKTYGPIMLQNGFHEITVEAPETFLFLKGDVVVIQNYPGGDDNGHIAAFDGNNWISDFVQHGFWPGTGYAKARPSYAVFRP